MNSGNKDAKGRTIFRGSRGGLYVLGESGQRLQPAKGRLAKAPAKAPAKTPAKLTNLPPNMLRLVGNKLDSRNETSLAMSGRYARSVLDVDSRRKKHKAEITVGYTRDFLKHYENKYRHSTTTVDENGEVEAPVWHASAFKAAAEYAVNFVSQMLSTMRRNGKTAREVTKLEMPYNHDRIFQHGIEPSEERVIRMLTFPSHLNASTKQDLGRVVLAVMRRVISCASQVWYDEYYEPYGEEGGLEAFQQIDAKWMRKGFKDFEEITRP